MIWELATGPELWAKEFSRADQEEEKLSSFHHLSCDLELKNTLKVFPACRKGQKFVELQPTNFATAETSTASWIGTDLTATTIAYRKRTMIDSWNIHTLLETVVNEFHSGRSHIGTLENAPLPLAALKTMCSYTFESQVVANANPISMFMTAHDSSS